MGYLSHLVSKSPIDIIEIHNIFEAEETCFPYFNFLVYFLNQNFYIMKNIILTTVFLFAGIFSIISADKIDVCAIDECTATATWNGGNYSSTAPNCAAAMAGLKAQLCSDGWNDPNGC